MSTPAVGEEPTLTVDGLATHFFTKAGVVKAVDGVSFTVQRGEVLGLVGESGSGKSITGFSIIGLIDPPGRIVAGSIRFKGTELTSADEDTRRSLRGNRIAMIFQDPMMTLNPVLRIDTQMVEAIQAHRSVSRSDALTIARDALAMTGMPSPEQRLRCYPHELSGGMRQRVAIATAFLNEPDLIIADEPTTALDVTIQAQILHEVQSLCRKSGTALIWISHDLAIVSALADRVAVMYAGRIVETAQTDRLIEHPRHPYTAGLMGSVPSHNRRGQRLTQIPGMTPSLLSLPRGCAFEARCNRAVAARCGEPQEMREFSAGHSARCCNPLTEEAGHV